ncbi:MAG: hypothetical protein SNJ74_07465 [Fimbriimonadaceae bacterium]
MTVAREGCRIVAVLGLAMAVGCRPAPPPEFPVWAEAPAPVRVDSGSGASFDLYAAAALATEETASAYLNRVSFLPRERQAVVELLGPQMAMLDRASRGRLEFRFQPVEIGTPPPFHGGWLLLGRAMAWRIEAALADQRYDDAVGWTLVATRFGFDLSHGGVADAALGFSVVEMARQAIIPGLPELSAAQHRRLAEGLVHALGRIAPAETALRNEHANMLLAVQRIQDRYRAREFDEIKRELGLSVRDAVEYLRRMSAEDSEKRPAYFQGFAEESEKWVDHWVELSKRNAAQRKVLLDRRETRDPLHLASYRPWRRFARALFATGEIYLRQRDAALARTRLLGLECWVRARIRTDRAAPPSLSNAPSALLIDPYSGLPFVYGAQGDQFRLYSVGPNLIDDGGETDDRFTSPDLTIERTL